MMAAARDAARAAARPPLLLGVTALTSLAAEDCRSIGVSLPVEEWTVRLAELALESGMDGIVASARELSSLASRFGRRLQYVVPGIRPPGSAAQDQARVAGPREAIASGADFLVVGRPILRSSDPALTADRIVEEIASALAATGSRWISRNNPAAQA